MARYDVYRLKDGGLVLVLQADLLSDLTTRVVAPLLTLDGTLKPASNLNPLFYVDGEKYMLGVQFLAAIPNRELQDYVCSLLSDEQRILKSIDMLFSGF
ncbi:CcdB family protein [Marinobacterium sp. LSUCC0821]|uniref:CcdB family protein n=1 Tax=Marinobacterium sp. LSUCC0821 TaxID=2668067 RepID=UPI0014518DF7|nr:CcdB family protein [Marinobacterium sp. LSUCC0821]QJD72198.1 plasmid maintenance protein CcdB [Marinobacterium sp. LSUCC0821]